MRGGAGKPNQMDENTNNVGQRIRNSKQHGGGKSATKLRFKNIHIGAGEMA